MSLALFVAIADGKHGFLWTINMDFRLHKDKFIRGVLVTKKDQKSAYSVYGHVHKYEAVLWTLKKLRKTISCYKMINFSLRELKFSGKKVF